MKTFYTGCICWFLTVTVFGQLPNTEIYMLSYTQVEDNFTIRNCKLLTHFNPDGYNNQPYFIDNDRLWLVTDYYASDNTEIVELNLLRNEMSRITKTPESEYSPKWTPDRAFFSCIRVDSLNNQNVWAYPYNRKNTGYNVLPSQNKVGYYTWTNESQLAMFELGPPIHLSIQNIGDIESTKVIEDIGRTLVTDNEGWVHFIHKMNDEFWFIKKYHPETPEKIETVTQTLSKVEDFALHKDGSYLMGNGSLLYRYDPSNNRPWVEVLDLKKYGISKITRLVTRHNKIVIVNEK